MDQAMVVRNSLLVQPGFPPCGIRAVEMASRELLQWNLTKLRYYVIARYVLKSTV